MKIILQHSTIKDFWNIMEARVPNLTKLKKDENKQAWTSQLL